MARDTTNNEGLTFEEWVCAAGVAVVDQGLVKPYTQSDTVYRPRPDWEIVSAPGDRLLVAGVVVPRHYPYRHKTTWYDKKIREAWKRGEDPTEWRAA